MQKEKVNQLFARLAAQQPEPKTELHYVNNYTLLVAVVLSAQATDVGVNKATAKLFQTVDTPEKMLRLGEVGLKQHIKTIGLFNGKAKNIIALSKILQAEHGGEIPRNGEQLQALPGVGRKTANVIMNCAFGAPTIAVDTHVFRVANRTGLASGTTPEQVEEQLLGVVPQRWRQHAHHWLILHGRYVCKARNPACPSCTIADLCAYKAKVKMEKT
jgi:endonuclease III